MYAESKKIMQEREGSWGSGQVSGKVKWMCTGVGEEGKVKVMGWEGVERECKDERK